MPLAREFFRLLRKLAWFIFSVSLLAACSAAESTLVAATHAPSQPPGPTAALESPTPAPQTATPLPPSPTPTQTSTPRPSLTATASPTASRIPPDLPAIFQTGKINKLSTPQAYIADTCRYLKDRWGPRNSPPGTVAMIVMFHSITENEKPLAADGSQVHHADMVRLMERAHELGFQTITAAQLADFLYHNGPIPQRSLLIIVDDRKRKEYYEKHFAPYLEDYGWTVTNAWISAVDTPEYLWKENQDVQAAGWVDFQAHGVVHNIPMGEHSTDEYMRGELGGSMDAITARFGKPPVGFIWPGGGFSRRSVELAREAGFRVGFTTNPRGPVMYNWVPQADKSEAAHPHWLPEIPAGNPLMTLPRYWSRDAAYRLEDVVAVGEEAAAYAQENRAAEMEYYDIVCKSVTGEIGASMPGN